LSLSLVAAKTVTRKSVSMKQTVNKHDKTKATKNLLVEGAKSLKAWR